MDIARRTDRKITDPKTIVAIRDLGCYLLVVGDYRTGYDGRRYNGGWYVYSFLGAEYGCFATMCKQGDKVQFRIELAIGNDSNEEAWQHNIVLLFDYPYPTAGFETYRSVTNYRGMEYHETYLIEEYTGIDYVMGVLKKSADRCPVPRSSSLNADRETLWFLLFGSIPDARTRAVSALAFERYLLPLMMDNEYQSTVREIVEVDDV